MYRGRGNNLTGHARVIYCKTLNKRLMRLQWNLYALVVLMVQGEVEIKDGDEEASHVSIEIEKTGPSELQTDGVTVNHTLFDVGHGSIFVLQLVRTNIPRTSHLQTN